MKKRITILTTVLILLVAFVGGWIWITRTSQSSLTLEKGLGKDGVTLPVVSMPYCAMLAPGLKFKIDTGADISTLSEIDADKLREMGYEIKESLRPMTGRDGYGRYIFSPKRYTVSLPIGGYDISTDSLGRRRISYTGSPTNKILNVDFAQTSESLSTLGLDFLKKFKLEFNYLDRSMTLHDSIPESYQHVANLISNVSLKDHIWSSDRVYMILTVNQYTQLYQLDTGLQRTAIKMPVSEIPRATHTLHDDSTYTMVAAYAAKVDDRAIVEFGNRCGSKAVYYYDNDEDTYQFNPLNVFVQDLVIDISGRGIYFRPTARKASVSTSI